MHDYSFFGSDTWTTESQWGSQFKGEVGTYSDRTICTEWGGPMSPGSKNGISYGSLDYSQSPTNYFLLLVTLVLPRKLQPFSIAPTPDKSHSPKFAFCGKPAPAGPDGDLERASFSAWKRRSINLSLCQPRRGRTSGATRRPRAGRDIFTLSPS